MCNVFGYVNICNKTSKKTRLRAVALFFMFKNCYNNARKAYDFMKQQKYNVKDLTLAYFQKKSKLYRAGGYKYATPLKRSLSDYQDHLFAFLMDINICLLPVYIWVIEFLLIMCGLIPPHFFDLLFYIMFALLFVSSVLLLAFFTARTNGQSFGYAMLDLKLVRKKDKKEAMPLNLILRQALGFGVPLMIFGFFFQVLGVILWWIINGIFVLVMPHQQTLFDLIFGLVPVREPDQEIRFETKPEPVKEELHVTPIDLHIRSNYSDDGYYDVEELFKQAKDNGLEVISITDHNCARANAAAMRFSSLYNIQYIPGVEIDAQYKRMRVRILGYYIDWTNEVFEVLEQNSLKREKELSIERVEKFENFSGIRIDVDSLMSNSRFQTITPTEITKMVFHNERTRSLPFVKKYLDNCGSHSAAMSRFETDVFGKNGPCYVKADYPDAKAVIDAIHNAGGIAILSSWHLDYIADEVLEEIVDLGMDGVECFSNDIHEQTIAAALKIVQKRKLFVSCGSDYHVPTKPKYHMGVSNCPEKALPLVRILTKAAK